MTEKQKTTAVTVLWWLAAAYALAAVAWQYFVGCGCEELTHTCGVRQYTALIGSVGWTILLPLGIRLFREREKALFAISLLCMLQAVCAVLLVFSPVLGGVVEAAADLLSPISTDNAGLVLLVHVCLHIPFLPYAGWLSLFPSVPIGSTVYVVLLLYSAVVAFAGVRRYREAGRREE